MLVTRFFLIMYKRQALTLDLFRDVVGVSSVVGAVDTAHWQQLYHFFFLSKKRLCLFTIVSESECFGTARIA